MALVHTQQHSPRQAAPKTAKSELIQLILLFLNLWGLLVVLPLLSSVQDISTWSWPMAVLPPGVFALGLGLHLRQRSRAIVGERPAQALAQSPIPGAPSPTTGQRLHSIVQRYTGRPSAPGLCWIIGVPLALALSISAQHERSTWIALNWGVPGLLLCSLSLWAYGAAAISQSIPAPHLSPTTVVPLASLARRTPEKKHILGQVWVPSLYAAGGLLLAVVAPFLAAEETFVTGSRSGQPWALLSAVIGAGLGTSCAGFFLSSALTEGKNRASRKPAQIAPYLLLAALGATTYYLVTLKSWP